MLKYILKINEFDTEIFRLMLQNSTPSIFMVQSETKTVGVATGRYDRSITVTT